MATCPTPCKHRFATAEAAAIEAARVRLALGLLLQPYDCRCGWVHLTKRVSDGEAR